MTKKQQIAANKKNGLLCACNKTVVPYDPAPRDGSPPLPREELTMATLRAVLAKPGAPSEVITVPASYKGVCDAVGGCISCITLVRVPFYDSEILLYVHDEALLECLPWNRFLVSVVEFKASGAVIVDRARGQFIAGNILAVAPGPEGEDRGLTTKEVHFARYYLDTMCHRLAPTPSSIEELEALTGRPAMGIAMTREEAEKIGIDPALIDVLFPKKEG
jgi:hypothetical protein